MAEILKPDFTHLWANAGTIVAPSNSKIDTGWTAEVPPYQWENFSQNRQDQGIAHILQHGISVWDSATEYQAGKSYVQGSNGLIYVALQTHTGQNPVSAPTYWEPYQQHGYLVFSTTGVTNWTVPLVMQLGIIKPKVTVVAAGASGARRSAQSGGGGGAGGAAIEVVDLTGVTSVAITVGTGGASPASDSAGNAGGSSSFGAFLSATGGLAIGSASFGGSEGGVGSGGTINIKGGGGGAAKQGIAGGSYVGGFGGNSILGAGAPESHASAVTAGTNGAVGSGGSGGILNGVAGTGGNGVVIVEW